jgi:hypothetical protein
MTTKTNLQKNIIFSAGGKGGGGKTTAMVSLVDFLKSENCPLTLIDADIENKVHGSLSHFFKEAAKVDITTPHGLDEFAERVLHESAPIVLADLGAGSGKYTFRWFDDMYEELKNVGVGFLTIGVVTSEVATTETVLNWANVLKNRVNYMIIRNHRNGDSFPSLEESELGQKFMRLAKPAVIDMEARLEDLQQAMDERGLSLRQAIEAPAETAGPLLSKAISKIRLRAYLSRIDAQFRRVVDTILPA